MKAFFLILIIFFTLYGCKKREIAIELPEDTKARKAELLEEAKTRYPDDDIQLERANFLITQYRTMYCA